MRRIRLLEVGVSVTTRAEAAAEMLRWVEDSTPHYVVVANVHLLVEAQRDARLRDVLNHTGMTVPDGMPLVWLARRAGADGTERVVGVELMEAVS
ncbi:MAG: glycosyltransferase, partial [Alphaproteobacteria bacterium]|nr:glycosyltransferase [Alphaproteobacteria bacterium]